MIETKNIRVLLVEDNATDALLVRDELAQEIDTPFTVVHVEHLQAALEQLRAQSFDVVLLDLSLPDSQGFDTFVQVHAAAPEVAVVVLSGRADGKIAVQAVQAGAQDYLVKGRLGEEVLHRSIRYAIERQRSERTLAESEERYRLLIESSPDGYLVHCDGIIVFANAAALRLLGAAQASQLLGKPILDRISPESQTVIKQRIQKAQGNDINLPVEVLCIRLDGTTVAVEGTSNPFMHQGKPAVQAVLRDITERKRSEERVREQAAMLDRAHDAIIVRDIHTRKITFWNQGAERLYGWTAAEAEGRDIGELIFADPMLPDTITEALLCTGEWRGEYHHVTKAAKDLTVGCHATLVHDAAGAPKSALLINIDITEQKALEARFLRAQRMESIGTLAGGIAHDLNNVLAPIMMSIDLLKLQEMDPKRLNILNTIEGSARRGANMVSQVLSFARGLEGQQLEVHVGHLLHEVEKIVNETFLKSIRVRCDVPADLWIVQGDPTQLHQVLLNLCVNARDAMPEGGVLKLSASNLLVDEHYAGMNPEASPGPHVIIQVEDTGTGMAPKIIDRIFEPFFTTKEVGKGTGLGLSTALGIIKSHGGFMRVYSEVGGGTRFQVYLPAQTTPGAELEATPQADLPHGRGELVLVVDDEVAVRQITRQTLEAFGYRVLLACDGAEATVLYAAQSQNIAVVLTDMMMPVMDGPTTILVLMRMNPEVIIIAASGLNANALVAKAVSAGVKHFLPKPYTAETLLRALREVLPKAAKVYTSSRKDCPNP